MKKDVLFVCSTNGEGLWSGEVKSVTINSVELDYLNGEKTFGELRAIFSKDSWNVREHNLIYTDPQWMKEFRQAMKNKFNLSDVAVQSIDYSEQGMQRDNFVSMDVGKPFIKEWLNE